MTLCYLGLGSNLCSPKRQLSQAQRALRKLPQSAIMNTSKLYFSPPLGIKAQPPYFNLVISLKTSLSPMQLLHYCQLIENKQKRLRKKHWGARTIDIDILFYGEQHIKNHKLTIPHPELHNRDFVLIPLRELSPSKLINQKIIASSFDKLERVDN